MRSKDKVRDFLISRRAHITPEQAGIPSFGERRVPGLRREEVATLAGISTDYYTRIERGNIRGASESVLAAIARALHLTDTEREYLFALAHTTNNNQTPPSSVRASVQQVLDSMNVPAIVHNANQDLIAANPLGRALYSPLFETSDDPPNIARFVFLNPRAQDYYVDWLLARRTTAAMMRLEAGRDPFNSALTTLIDELVTHSPQFRED